MKIVNVIGGLGNQMFQAAFALALQEKYKGETVKLDVSHFIGYGLHNGFEIKKVFPDYPIEIANKDELKKVTRYIPNYRWSRLSRRILPSKKTEYLQPYQLSYMYDPKALMSEGDLYFEGYWMCAGYGETCRDVVLRAFTFRPFDSPENKQYEKDLLADNSVTIHIRRGDYVGAESFKDICTLSYYRRAIAEVKKKIAVPVFFVFSNDQQWCKENLQEEFAGSIVYFVSNNKGTNSYRDMQLMTLARCNILANSSFSWWGAYLNKREDQIVYCPEKWVNGMEHKDHFVKGWIKLSIL